MNKHDVACFHRLPTHRHRSAGFFLAGFPMAIVVSTALFWVMYQLISIAQIAAPAETLSTKFDYYPSKKQEQPVEKRTTKPDRPPVVDLPAPAPMTGWTEGNGVPSFVFDTPEPGDLFGPAGNSGIGIGEREYMPLTEIQPEYPESAIHRNIQGTCVVLYTITRTGSVSDVRIDEHRCTSTLFHRPSLRAASKFKYAPRIVDGQAVEVRHVAKKFRFSILE